MRVKIVLCLLALTALSSASLAQERSSGGNAGPETKSTPVHDLFSSPFSLDRQRSGSSTANSVSQERAKKQAPSTKSEKRSSKSSEPEWKAEWRKKWQAQQAGKTTRAKESHSGSVPSEKRSSARKQAATSDKKSSHTSASSEKSASKKRGDSDRKDAASSEKHRKRVAEADKDTESPAKKHRKKETNSDTKRAKASVEKHAGSNAKSKEARTVSAERSGASTTRSAAAKSPKTATHVGKRRKSGSSSAASLAAGPAAPTSEANRQSNKPADTLFGQTKPDGIGTTGIADHPQESPMTALGDAWKMLLYLVPMLLVIIGALRLLRRFQETHGRLPGALQAMAQRSGKTAVAPHQNGGILRALLGGLQWSGAKQRSESSIHLIESTPVGGMNLHLVQVRGKVLLLGASATGISVLTEFQEQEGVLDDDFRRMLQTAAADMDSLDLDRAELPATTLVGSLESAMRETGDAMSRRIRRLRTVQEAEAGVD